MVRKHLWILLWTISLSVCLVNLSTANSITSSRSTAPIPKVVKKNKGGGGFFSNSVLHRWVREAKISFCSELEALTLQLTRPNSDAINPQQLDDLVNFINHEYDNPELLMGTLVKLSRKFAEPNIYTQLKTLLTLHYLFDHIETTARKECTAAVNSMRSELDQKFGKYYFHLDGINDAVTTASTVMELEAIEFTREYAPYLFEYLDYLRKSGSSISILSHPKKISHQKKVLSTTSLPVIVELAERLMKLLLTNEKLCISISHHTNSLLLEQILGLLSHHQKLLLQQLISIYETHGNLDNQLDTEILKVIQSFQPNFLAMVRSPSLSMEITSNSSPTTTSTLSTTTNAGKKKGMDKRKGEGKTTTTATTTTTIPRLGSSEDNPLSALLGPSGNKDVMKQLKQEKNHGQFPALPGKDSSSSTVKTSRGSTSTSTGLKKTVEIDKKPKPISKQKLGKQKVAMKVPSSLQKSLEKSLGITPARLPSGPLKTSKDSSDSTNNTATRKPSSQSEDETEAIKGKHGGIISRRSQKPSHPVKKSTKRSTDTNKTTNTKFKEGKKEEKKTVVKTSKLSSPSSSKKHKK